MRVRWLVAALLPCALAALQYAGQQCEGFIDFELADDTPVAQLEQAVANALNSWAVPMWLAQSCKLQLRRILCLSSYSHYAAPEPLEVCVSVCDDVHSASACEKVIGYVTTTLMRTESPFYDLLVDCKAWPALNCTAGGDTYSYFAADNAVCPEPLLPTRPGMQDASELVEPSLLGIADCNAACPSNIYVNSEWEVLSDGLQGAVWLSLVASLLVGVFQTWQGEKLQLLSGLPAATSLLSAVAIIELFANGYERVYCEDDVYVVEDDEACVMQSALTLFCATSTAAIVVCQAHSAYIRLDKTRKQASTPWLNVLYVLLIAVIPALYVAYAYQSDWLGFDKHQELPFCTLTYDTSSTFANLDLRLFGPQMIALFACFCMLSAMITRHLAFTCATRGPTSRIGEIMMQTQVNHARQSSASSRPTSLRVTLTRIMRRDMQSSIFIAMYITACACLLAVAALFHHEHVVADNHATEWYECILTTTARVRDVDAGLEECGDHPNHALTLALPGFMMLFFGAPGILLALAFLPVAYRTCIEACRQNPSSDVSRQSSHNTRTPSSQNTLVARTSHHSHQTPTIHSAASYPVRDEKSSTVHVVDSSPQQHNGHLPASLPTHLPTPPIKQRTPRRGAAARLSDPREFQEGSRIIVGTTIVATVRSYLGEGRFGGIFLATDKSGGRQYVVKCARLPPDNSGSGIVHPSDVVNAFCDQLHANLRSSPHPNVMNLYKICKDDSPSAPANRHVIFLDVMEGCDLLSFLQKRRSVWLGARRSVQEIQQHLFSLTAQLVNGLIWIHSRGVLHRDIQPSNIMIDPTGQEVHIAGFEMATVAARLDEHGQPVCTASLTRHGTAAYRSPEIAQAQGAPIEVCPRTSDLWAAALTILQMYCGGNCLWQDRFPRTLPGEHGVRALAAYEAVEKDRLFDVEYFADLVEFHDALPEPLVNALRSCSFGSAMPDITVRMLFGLGLHDESMLDDLRTHYSLNMGDVLRLRRIERQIFVLSMPPPLQEVLRAALSPFPEDRPASAEEWQQRLLALPDDAHSQCLDDALVEVIHRAENITCAEVPAEDKAMSFVNLGHVFYGLLDFPSAKRCFMEALELSDQDDDAVPPLALYRLGKCYLAEGDIARGRQLLERVIKADNSFGKAHYALAELARADGRIEELQHHLKRCVELDTMYDHPKPRWMLGQVLRLVGSVTEAPETYEQCVAEYLGFAPAEAYLALEHFLDGDNEAALSHAKSAFDLDSGDVVGSYLLAMLYQMRGDHVLARELFANALAASGGWCHVSMADLFWAYGAVDKAVECLQRAVQQFPEDEALAARLAELSAVPRSTPCPSVQEVVARVSSHADGVPNLVY